MNRTNVKHGRADRRQPGGHTWFAAAWLALSSLSAVVRGDDPPPAATEPASNEAAEITQRIVDRMSKAATRIEETRLDEETTADQTQVLADLDRLLELADQQSPSQQRTATAQPGSVDEPMSGSQDGEKTTSDPGDQGRGPAGDPASRSTEQLGSADPAGGDRERRRNLATSVWGHLPPRLQEEMQRSFSERYLPQYDELVRKYYEALAEKRTQSKGK